MRNIPLTQGKFAIVDDEDYKWLNQWRWRFNSSGDAVRWSNGSHKTRKIIEMSRVILNASNRFIYVDHINHNRLDNRKINLRECTPQQNSFNKKINKLNASGYKGVKFDKERKKWRVDIKINGKKKYIGRFDSVLIAARAYDVVARKYFGEFAYCNFR